MLQRDGKVEAMVIEKADGKTIKPLLFDRINKDATVITDGFGAYNRIKDHFSEHVVINHAKNEYAFGKYNTNSIEGFWSLVKRGFFEIYHYVSKKHMQKYLNTYAFRYNARNDSVSDRFNFLISNMTKRLTYNQLING